jgi:Mg2+/citrate symporter
MMEMVSMYQEQIQKAEADAERRSKKVLKVEQILHEGKDKMWSICARLARVPAIVQVAGRGITQSQTESNLVNIRTLLPELDRYLPIMMRLFASVVPADARYSVLEISPPWSSPVQRPIISIVDR